MGKPIPMTAEQTRICDELAGFTGRLFMQNGVSAEVGLRMLATMVTWMAVQSGLSSAEYGELMRDMHEHMKKAGN